LVVIILLVDKADKQVAETQEILGMMVIRAMLVAVVMVVEAVAAHTFPITTSVMMITKWMA
jgi:hypothetical protein